MASTTASFSCWLPPPSSYPRQFRHFVSGMPSQSSDKPNLFSVTPIRLSDKPNLFSVTPIRLSDKPNLFSVTPIRLSDKPNLFRSIKSALKSNSIPMHLLLWVFVGLWFAQGEIYFRAGYLILDLCLYL